ncbi:hypothetical protein [Mesorhizobium wenxiniae]|nr:hypothetical protein [Mesorhizobium wenxiniae]
MATMQQEPNTTSGLRLVTPAQGHSAAVKFIDKVMDRESSPTSVEIYAIGNNWYCNVRCGDKRTRPMGPYSKQQAERMQDVRRMLIAKRCTARLMFE